MLLGEQALSLFEYFSSVGMQIIDVLELWSSDTERPMGSKLSYLLTCLLVKSSPMAQVGPLREHPLRVAPRSYLGWIARAFLVRRGATGQLSAFCRPPENSSILQSFSFH